MVLFRLYFPTKDKENNMILKNKHEKALNYVKKQFSDRFGGFTSFNGFGGWLNPKKDLIQEKVIILESSKQNKDKTDIDFINNIALTVKTDLNQESVMIQIIDNETSLFI